MERAPIFMQQELDMKVNGIEEENKGKELFILLMDMYIKDLGKMIGNMAMEHYIALMVLLNMVGDIMEFILDKYI